MYASSYSNDLIDTGEYSNKSDSSTEQSSDGMENA
jgi:hypothetical protein